MPAGPASRIFTRRDFLWRISRYGGAVVLGAMTALDLMARDQSARFQLAGRAPATKKRVVIVGGGLAGMCAAYELGKLGYQCVVLEARARPGGRCWTVRRGTKETELGRDPQTCAFGDGLLLNAGPMRISHTHGTTINYCREFGIPLVAFTNVNDAAYVYCAGRPKMRMREVRADLHGYTAELLAKAVRKDALDLPLNAEDREKLIEFLRFDGGLNAELLYPRPGGAKLEGDAASDYGRGYVVEQGTNGEPGQPTVPVDLEVLIKSGFGALTALGGGNLAQQPTMLAAVGGMDRLANAFARRIGPVLRQRAIVREIRRTAGGGVRVGYADETNGGKLRAVEGDFCVWTMPPVLLPKVSVDFASETSRALGAMNPGAAGKIGLQFKRRFWEEDDGIYGGVTQTDLPITSIVYPPDGFGTRNGVLLGYYHFGNAQRELNDQPIRERERLALEQGSQIHPQYRAEFENSFSVAWDRVPYSEMSWIQWNSGAEFEAAAKALETESGPFYFAGDWLTYHNGWQTGAFLSAQKACRRLHARATAG
jgi:monoamine oxidase